MSAGIYIHIPFCKSKCKYCDFNSSNKYWEVEDDYVKAVIDEINQSDCKDKIDTVFIGGGTPTAIKTENLLKIIDTVINKFSIKDAEFTVECNPATIGYDGFVLMKNYGANRISLGLQSTDNSELAFLGRIHTFEGFLQTYNDAKKAGIENINIDLMFSLPDQNVEKWHNTLHTAAKLNPAHISCYSLIVEEGTPFYDIALNLPDEETDRKMYYDCIDILKNYGYEQYEISNFAKKGYECRHNIKYWKRENYLGFGCGASGLYNGVRIDNTYNIFDYIKNNNPKITRLTRSDEMAEHIFLGLRLTEGFDVEEFNRVYQTDFEEVYKDIINKYKRLGLLEVGKNCRLTREGISISNTIMSEFV